MIEPRIFFINELEEETGNICAVYLRVVNLQIKHKALINFLLLIMWQISAHECSIEIVYRSGIKLFLFPINSLQSCLIPEICCLRVETKHLF